MASGGKREGAGRKPAGYVPPPSRVDFEMARARNEAAKADLNELDLRIKRSEYVPRSDVRLAAATALSILAQTLRSVPDNLERTAGIAPSLAEQIGTAIENALAAVADAFEELHEGAAAEEEGRQRPT